MRKGIKIVLCIITVMVFGLIFNGIKEGTGRSAGAGPFTMILAVGMFAAVGAIWKYNPDKVDNESSDKHNLNKK